MGNWIISKMITELHKQFEKEWGVHHTAVPCESDYAEWLEIKMAARQVVINGYQALLYEKNAGIATLRSSASRCRAPA